MEKVKIVVPEESYEMYQTSDGEQFEHESEAAQHEFELKVKYRELDHPFNGRIMYLSSPVELSQAEGTFLNACYYKDGYDKTKFEYPQWFFSYYDDGDPNVDYSDRGNILVIKTFDEMVELFKNILLEVVKPTK